LAHGAESCQTNQEPLLKLSDFKQKELSASRIADYLKDPATSHVQPQHISSKESLRILSKKKADITALDAILNNNKQ
jgi:hypothetical protein